MKKRKYLLIGVIILILLLSTSSSLGRVTSIKKDDENNAPKAPIITGPTNPRVGRECHYKFQAVDPDGDDISYFIDLGDGITIGWTKCVPSGTVIHVYHPWKKGTYTITAKAKDCPHGIEGPEAALTVTVPRNRAINTPFQNFLENHPILYQLLLRFLRL